MKNTITAVLDAADVLLPLAELIRFNRQVGGLVTDEMLERHVGAQVQGLQALLGFIGGLNFTTVRERQATSIECLAHCLGFEVTKHCAGRFQSTDIETTVGMLRITRTILSRERGRETYGADAILRVIKTEGRAELDASFDVREVADVVEPGLVYDYDQEWSQELPGVAA